MSVSPAPAIRPPPRQLPGAAPLENPLYYLENADAVVRWSLQQHSDLLTGEEAERLERFLALPVNPRALLVRMVTRTRDLFRPEDLHYPELTAAPEETLSSLAAGGWVDPDPEISIEDLFGLYRKNTLFACFEDHLLALGLTRNSRKSAMAEALAGSAGERRLPVSRWLGNPDYSAVALKVMPLFERVRLMFFGNLRQDWSEFVITELGHQRYEPVAISRDSRAFQCRQEVDLYLRLHRHGTELEEGGCLETLWQALPKEPLENPWLDHRRRRLIFRFGQAAEREGEADLALAAYRCAWTEDARIRYFRVKERREKPDLFLGDLIRTHRDSATESERILLGRIIRRLDRHHPAGKRANNSDAWTRQEIRLPLSPGPTVEEQALAFFAAKETPCFYVENALFNSLLGLLIWPALYAPLPGAFFHSFQSGPADLFRDDFVRRRRRALETCLDTLKDGSYRQRIRHYRESRWGISCPLVAWPLLSDELVDLALKCIPAPHLERIFRRLLSDLKRHRSGFPDLILFRPGEKRYELIEVKGPGDRLQDHQRLWLRYFSECGIPARVCHITREETP